MNQSHRKQKIRAQNGFTLAEVLISLGILATLGAIMAPMAMDGLGSKKLTYQVQAAISEINRGFSSQIRENGMIILGPGGTTADQIVKKMNYVRIDRTSTIQILNTIGVNTTNNSSCTATQPCAVLQDGGYLQYGRDATFAPAAPGRLSALIFNYDPDGPGMQPATTFFLYSQGRITSSAWAERTLTDTDGTNSPGYSPMGLPNSDPEYIWGLTYENG